MSRKRLAALSQTLRDSSFAVIGALLGKRHLRGESV